MALRPQPDQVDTLYPVVYWPTVLSCAWLVLASLSAAAADEVPTSITLSVGSPDSRSLRAGDSLVFDIEALDEQALLLVVDQNGLDVRITIVSPAGETRRFNSPLERDDHEIVLLEPVEAGRYSVELSSDEHTQAVAQPVIELRPVATAPTSLLGAWRAMTRGAAANAAGGQENWRSALDAYGEAVDLWAAEGDQRWQAMSLFAVAQIEYVHMLKWSDSAGFADGAAALYAGTGEQGLAANARHLQAAALIEEAHELHRGVASDRPRADELFAQALALFEQSRATQDELGQHYDAARTINNVGLTHYYRGDWDSARANFREAAARFRSLNESSGELMPLSNLAVIDWEQGELTAARTTLERILVILPPGKLMSYRGDTLDNLAGVNLAMGDLMAALQGFSTALAVHESIDNPKGQGRSLAGIGITYYGIGERELAQDYLERALAVRRAAGDGRGQASVLRYLGNLYRFNGDYDRAREAHEEALELATSPADRAKASLMIGEDLIAAGRYEEAMPILDSARETAREAGARVLEADLLLALAEADAGNDQDVAARSRLEAALATYESIGLEAGQARSLYALARLEQDAGRLEEAGSYAAAAVEQIERLRSRIVDPELRAFYLGTRRGYFERYIDILMEQARTTGDDGFVRAALEVSERARARTMVDLLHEAAVAVTSDASSELEAQQRTLYDRLSELRFRRARIVEKSEDPARLDEIAAELASIENQLNVLDLELRRRNPQYAELTRPKILTADQLQALLDDDTVLLQYALGESRSYLWIVTPGRVEAAELPGRGDIESLARRVHENLSVFDSGGRRELSVDLARLSEKVLAPATHRLVPGNRILVVADGALQYIPFAVLSAADESGRERRLLGEFDVVNAPSMSAVAATRENRRSDALPHKTIAIIADPVFGTDDPRAADLATAVQTAPTPRPAHVDLAGPATLPRLPYSGREAAEVAGLVPSRERWLAAGFDANRRAVLEAPLGDYRLLHFATHGVFDARYPALSRLELSRIDRDGRPINGDFRLHDVYNLRLGAEVVVLSACDTALGREIHGEGLIGLSQGFMYAGARSVVASLWRVPDRTTSELMQRFYTYLLEDGLTASQALAAAQRDVAAKPLWRDPFYWGAFVIQGDVVDAGTAAATAALGKTRESRQ